MQHQTLRAAQPAHRSHKIYTDTTNRIHNILWATAEFVAFAVFVATCIALISISDLLDQYIQGGI